ncbi:hypothetical protein KC19_VG220700 [Ceratodon purpureus]|uniref:Secreted protein n=1 Tax=Ceratodon purpureus TaxID=3225 RepID=A0A8T0HSB6_CERPU|nr:hypothetical protein KC19_VG220700 [Ceratodon purpureus]
MFIVYRRLLRSWFQLAVVGVFGFLEQHQRRCDYSFDSQRCSNARSILLPHYDCKFDAPCSI